MSWYIKYEIAEHFKKREKIVTSVTEDNEAIWISKRESFIGHMDGNLSVTGATKPVKLTSAICKTSKAPL